MEEEKGTEKERGEYAPSSADVENTERIRYKTCQKKDFWRNSFLLLFNDKIRWYRFLLQVLISETGRTLWIKDVKSSHTDSIHSFYINYIPWTLRQAMNKCYFFGDFWSTLLLLSPCLRQTVHKSINSNLLQPD